MKCSRCGADLVEGRARCPRCGRDAGGVFQTSSVLISAEGAERVYRSVDEVPPPMRTRLLKSTNGANSATILIADRRGRREIARALHSLPGPARRRLLRSILGRANAGGRPASRGKRLRWALFAALLLVALALIALVRY